MDERSTEEEEAVAAKRGRTVQKLKSYQPCRSSSPGDLEEDSSVAWAATKESWEDAPETPPLQRSRSSSPASLEEGIQVICETEDYIPNEPTERNSPNACYICGNLAILLATCLLMVPLLVFIVMPNLFIITGQRQHMEEYFYLAYFIAICLTDTGFFILLCHESRDAERATFRDALLATVGYMAAALGILIGARLIARLMWYPLTYVAYAVRVVWHFLANIAIWLWGGTSVFKGSEGDAMPPSETGV